MLVSGGYPDEYAKGYQIVNLDKITDSIAFHAGTMHKDGVVVSNGGRVMAVTSYGEDIKSALEKSNNNAALISYRDKYYRKDIGLDLL
jgi:phosphoribosylamine--glycine ligase